MKYSKVELERLFLRQSEQERQRVATAGKAFYTPFRNLPDTRLPYYAALCNEACLELNPKARPLYIEVITALKRPGIKLLKSNRDMEHPDYINLIECTSKYILNAFNNPDRLDMPRINPDSDKSVYLISAIIETAIVEMQCITFKELDRQMQGEDYFVMQQGTDDITSRPDRTRRAKLTRIAKQCNLNLVHEDGLYELAKLWYFGRIIKDNLTAASQLGICNSISIPMFVHPGTACHKVEVFDIATGYKS